MRKKNHSPFKKQGNQPAFLVDDDSQGSRAYCETCAQYEEDISILQQKLMQTHNKLIQQIDLCRQQQLKIINLTKKLSQPGTDQQNNIQTINMNPRVQSGKIFKKSDEQYLHSVEPLIEAKTELLRNDLEAMRSKVLAEINKSNRLKQENHALQIKHQKQLRQYKQKIRKIDLNKNKLIQQNQQLLQQIEQLRKLTVISKHSKCACGYQSKYTELDKAFMNQRTITNQLIQENNRLQNKIHDLYEDKAKGPSYQFNDYSHNKTEQIRTEPKRRRHTQKEKSHKEEFEATKNLIKKLEQAENQMRNKIL